MIAQSDVPNSQAAVLDSIEDERRKLREWAETRIRETEEHRDAGLKRLDAAVAALNVEVDAAPEPPPELALATPEPEPKPRAQPKRKRRSRRGTRTNSPAAAKQRQADTLAFLVEKGEPVKAGVVRSALGYSPNEAKTALTRLVEAGKAERHGDGAGTTYEAVRKAEPASSAARPTPAPSSADAPPSTNGHGTTQGRILLTLEGTHGMSLTGLTEQLGVTRDELVQELGALVREGEVRVGRKAGEAIYVPTA